MSAETITVGRCRISRVLDGTFLVDGGAMFGVVPRTLWRKRAVPDGENRITLALSCYLVQTPRSTILVETGVGPDVDRRYMDFYSFERHPGLSAALAGMGVAPDRVDYVWNSHLHFDHCGGNTAKSGSTWRPAFPRARYVIQRGEWEAALHPVDRDRQSYLPRRLEPIQGAAALLLVDGDSELEDGVESILVPGHTAFHQCLKIVSGGETWFYFGDLVPTAAHIDLPYIMSYDLYPVETFANKKKLYERAVAEGWTVSFSHDPALAFGTILKTGHTFRFVSPGAPRGKD